jgi:hypothetical protein
MSDEVAAEPTAVDRVVEIAESEIERLEEERNAALAPIHERHQLEIEEAAEPFNQEIERFCAVVAAAKRTGEYDPIETEVVTNGHDSPEQVRAKLAAMGERDACEHDVPFGANGGCAACIDRKLDEAGLSPDDPGADDGRHPDPPDEEGQQESGSIPDSSTPDLNDIDDEDLMDTGQPEVCEHGFRIGPDAVCMKCRVVEIKNGGDPRTAAIPIPGHEPKTVNGRHVENLRAAITGFRGEWFSGPELDERLVRLGIRDMGKSTRNHAMLVLIGDGTVERKGVKRGTRYREKGAEDAQEPAEAAEAPSEEVEEPTSDSGPSDEAAETEVDEAAREEAIADIAATTGVDADEIRKAVEPPPRTRKPKAITRRPPDKLGEAIVDVCVEKPLPLAEIQKAPHVCFHTVEDVRNRVGKLYREGYLRMRRVDGETCYQTAEA